MRYLPREGTHHWDPFWKTIVDGIKQRLGNEKVLRTRGKGVLRRIRDVGLRALAMNDCHGNPLFQDLDPEIYLADAYIFDDLNILRSFNLEYVDFGQILRIVEADLALPGIQSRLRSPNKDDDWHGRAAKLLSLPFTEGWDHDKAPIRKLALIPLRNGSWTRSTVGDIFYPQTNGILIPRDLGLRLVATQATENAQRRALFDYLGVTTASVKMVRSAILNRYSTGHGRDVDVDTSRSHLEFLYLTHESRTEEEPIQVLPIHDHLGIQRDPDVDDGYIRDDRTFGPNCLLGSAGLSRVKAYFANPKYFENVPGTRPGTNLTWLQWMYKHTGLRRNLRLISRDKKSISPECKFVAEHRQEKLLGFLRHAWKEQGEEVKTHEAALEELKFLTIKLEDDKSCVLSNCYMPREELLSVWRRFACPEFPFLDIESHDETGWSFLTRDLEVKCKNDLQFRIDLLLGITRMPEETFKARRTSWKVMELYRYIEAFCMESPSPRETRGFVL